ncbi:MAG: anti-sigma factor domain-containing protein [Clostridiaceae bacterium]|nr:anti-sigma factor domain-containing protein [Clostridiaceae bacterium]
MAEFNKFQYSFSKTVGVVDISDKALNERKNQIAIMDKELYSFNVFLKDLVSHKPDERTRNLILNIAYYLVENNKYLDRILEKKELPFIAVHKVTGISRNFLEIWQDYILAYIVILSNPGYKYIQDYLRIEENRNSTEIVPIAKAKVDDVYKGIVIEIKRKYLIIMTSNGEFIKIKSQEEVSLGEEVRGKEKIGIRHFKVHFAIAMTLILIMACAAYYNYNKVVSTVVVTGTFQIKLELNSNHTVIYSYAPTKKGQDLVDSEKPLDKNIDQVLRDFVKYSKDEDIIPQDGIVVTITGKPLEYGVLIETAKYVYDNDIKINVNNCGSKHNIYELAKEQEK